MEKEEEEEEEDEEGGGGPTHLARCSLLTKHSKNTIPQQRTQSHLNCSEAHSINAFQGAQGCRPERSGANWRRFTDLRSRAGGFLMTLLSNGFVREVCLVLPINKFEFIHSLPRSARSRKGPASRAAGNWRSIQRHQGFVPGRPQASVPGRHLDAAPGIHICIRLNWRRVHESLRAFCQGPWIHACDNSRLHCFHRAHEKAS